MKLSDDNEIFEVTEKNLNIEKIQKRIEKEKLVSNENISKSMLHLRKEPTDKEKNEIHSIFKESISALNTYIKQEETFHKKKNNQLIHETTKLENAALRENNSISTIFIKKEISQIKTPKNYELSKNEDSFKEIKKIINLYLSYSTKNGEEPTMYQYSENNSNCNFFGDKSYFYNHLL